MILFLNQAFIFGCFAPYCIVAGMPHTAFLAFLLIAHTHRGKHEEDTEPTSEPASKPDDAKPPTDTTEHTDVESVDIEVLFRELKKKPKSKPKRRYYTDKAQEKKQTEDYLKQKGDAYERYIGMQFEAKGDVVVYNGLMRGYEDEGVDIVVISPRRREIHLIQCKNWTRRPMVLGDVEAVYHKLDVFDPACVNRDAEVVGSYLQTALPKQTLREALNADIEAFTVRKTLYVSSDKVIDLAIGKELRMIRENIFRYKDMKIVVVGEV